MVAHRTLKDVVLTPAFLPFLFQYIDVVTDWLTLYNFWYLHEWVYVGVSLGSIFASSCISTQLLISFHSFETFLGIPHTEFKKKRFNHYKILLYLGSIFQLGVLVEFANLLDSQVDGGPDRFIWQNLCETVCQSFPQMLLQFTYFFSKAFETLSLQFPKGYLDYEISLVIFRVCESINRFVPIAVLLVSSMSWYWKVLFLIAESTITTFVFLHSLPVGIPSQLACDRTRWASPDDIEAILNDELPWPEPESILRQAWKLMGTVFAFGFLYHAFSLPDYIGPYNSPDEFQGIFVGWYLVLRGCSSFLIVLAVWDEFWYSLYITILSSWLVCVVCVVLIYHASERLTESKKLDETKICPWGHYKPLMLWFCRDIDRREWMAENFGLLQQRVQAPPFWVTPQKFVEPSRHKDLKVLIEQDEFFDIALETDKDLKDEGRQSMCCDYHY